MALEHRRRCGMAVNGKRVARIKREDNLLAVQPKPFVSTTDSKHALEVSCFWPPLASDIWNRDRMRNSRFEIDGMSKR